MQINEPKQNQASDNPIFIDSTMIHRKISMKDDENIEIKIFNLSIFEEERQLFNLRRIIAKNILPTLSKIEINDVNILKKIIFIFK